MFKNNLHLLKICFKKISNLKLKCHSSNFISVPNNEVLKLANIDSTVLKPYFDPKVIQDDYFDLKKLISIEEMFEARVHYGHKIGTLKDNMKWALFGERLDVCIFDLNITEKYLLKALKFLAYMSYYNGIILFIATCRSQMLPTEKFAASIGQYSHTRKWQESTFENSRAIYGAPIRLPDLVVFFGTLTSVLERHPAILECAKLAIPTIAIVDSNAEPNYITYPIPGNDDSFESFKYYKKLFGKAIEAGANERKKEEILIEEKKIKKNVL